MLTLNIQTLIDDAKCVAKVRGYAIRILIIIS
ncbi:hypothetical protein Thiowin_02697 [Thiorhodovibrio winogradskyi]|uniref:Transposase n=1 Tax=Thiorhodovibrio winogradskyi TaxID=77007 RepID=A0ABZ0SB38_9GAMM